jgi:DNA-directed RNA polymerase subunit beta'
MKAIQVLVNSHLPVDLRDYNREYDSKSLGSLMAEVARKYPDQYERISKAISDIGRKASYFQGESLTLSDNRPVMDRDKLLEQMDAEIAEARRSTPDKNEFEKIRLNIWSKYNDKIQKETTAQALARKNNLAYSVVSGARGKPAQLKMMLSTPGLYTDAQDNIIPLFVRKSFGEGLRPAEYLAGTYGARKAVLSTKRATAKGGDLAKQMVQSASNLVITENDCGVSNGIDLSSDDKSLRGRVLAKGIGNIPAGTVLDKEALANIRKKGVETLIVRSPMTCQAKEGICAKCLGLNAEGKFSAKGEAVGITAAQAIGEPITQGALNVKHQGGAAGTSQRFAGFSVINQFVQTPDTFPDKAVLSKKDGQVNSIVEAPQGGYYVTVDEEPHYVAPGYPVTVKVGERVEAGDMMSEGLADPGEVVELRGLGEGRKYYSDKLKQLLDDSGMEADRRNTEIMARAALDHLQITDVKDDENEYLPDDVVSYSYFSKRYTPPVDTTKVKVDKAVGTYLQSPTLHYTIGTKVTPKIAKHISSAGFSEVFTSKEAPTFKPHMVRLRAATHHGSDWLASMHTSYLKKQLSESAIRGEESDVESNVHFAPRLAIGSNFAENIEQTGKF